jgi:hypothetical protein
MRKRLASKLSKRFYLIEGTLQIKKKSHLIFFSFDSKVKNVSRTRNKSFYLQFCMGTEGHQKSIINTSKVKKQRYISNQSK